MALSKKQRSQLKQKYGGRCAYCGELLEDRWHADHIEAVMRKTQFIREGVTRKKVSTGEVWKPENEHIDNYNPSCPQCNLFKATFPLEDFRRELQMQSDRARKYSVNFRMAEKYGLIKSEPKPVVFWFEQYHLSNLG